MKGSEIMRAAGEAAKRKGLPTTLQQHEILLGIHLTELGYGDYEREFRFHPKRKWRFDYAVVRPDLKLAIEIEGGLYGRFDKFGRFSNERGGHTSAKGYQEDMEKYNTAVVMGWDILRFSVDDVLKGKARETLKQYKKVREL